MEAGIAASHALDVLTVAQQHAVVAFDFIGVALPFVESSQVSSQDEKRDATDVVGAVVASELPTQVGEGVLQEAHEVLDESALVASVDWLASQSELLEFPVVLLAHAPVHHFESLHSIGSSFVHVVEAEVPVYILLYLILAPSSTGACRTHR